MAKAPLALGLVGCGGMGLRHIQGLVELQRAGISPFELIAVCDARVEAATRAADMAEEGLGRRPEVHTGLDELLAGPTGQLLDAVDLVTDVGAHHSVGVKVLEAGKHLISEKPLGLTVKACRVMLDAAARSAWCLPRRKTIDAIRSTGWSPPCCKAGQSAAPSWQCKNRSAAGAT